MTTQHGFELLREETIPELNVDARLWRHLKSGAQLLSVRTDDENKVFGVSFRTPPTDSTGIAHILEHAVLGGSQKYPLKEPFVQLIKGSLKTFVNAFTSPDKTTYPVASQNLQDFYNLIDVYLDAVFHPLITRHHLEQEGWHYELESLDAPLVYKGVVYNEMKGVYSSPDSLFSRAVQRGLFPDNTYGHDSGGDPRAIPDLTYAQFTDFHATYYHPSNAYLFFYGDDPEEERLRILDHWLGEYDAMPVDGLVALQAPFATPQRQTLTYGVDDETDLTKKAMTSVAWALPEIVDPALSMGLGVLSYSIVGTQGAPLRKALVDAGLGEDVFGGFAGGLRQPTFRAGIKGMDAVDADRVEALILSTLTQLAADGVDPEQVEAAVNSIEFSLRENNTGAFPRGLSLFMRALSTWLYAQDPLAALAFEAPLAAVKEALQDDQYLPGLIRTYLLENTHRITTVLLPDPAENGRQEAAERQRLEEVRAGMSIAELDAIIENTRLLKERQETPDSPELLASLPTLKLSDLEPKIKTIPLEVSAAEGSTTLYHDLFTNGIVYLDLAFDMHVLPAHLLPYADFFARALTKLGTETEDYVKLSRRIGSRTGGIYATDTSITRRGEDECTALFLLRGKATVARTPDMLAIMRDMLLTVKLDNQARFRQVVLETKARVEASLVPSGHSYVNGRLGAHFSEADWLDEQMSGIAYLEFVRQLAEEVDHDWSGVLANLEAVRTLLINRNGLVSNVTLDADNWQTVQGQLGDFLDALPNQPTPRARWTRTPLPTYEGLAIPAQVNYVGKAANLYALGYGYHGSIHVITNLVRTSWLWDKIRAQGGAYGAFARFAKQSGTWSYLSYRDPNLVGTLENYDGTGAFLRRYVISDDELTKGIIGAIGALDGYQLPDAKGYTSMLRYFSGETDAIRQQTRDEILGTTQQHIRDFAEYLEAANQAGHIVVMGAGDTLRTASQELATPLEIRKVL